VKVAAVLALYAVLLAVVPARVLARAAWPSRCPRAGIALWQALSASALLAAAGAGLALALPALRFSGDLSAVLKECVMALRAQYAAPGGAFTAAVGAAFAATVLASAGWCVSRELMAAAAARRTHRDLLRLTSWPCDPDRVGAADPVVVQHASLAAYCLPGRGGRIVLTSAALAALSPGELAAVLAHERAHLSGRHHLALAAAAGLDRAFGFVPLFRTAREQTAVLLEMLADDRASRAAQPLTVASALLRLAAPGQGSAAPIAALGAAETATGDRVRRLLVDRPPVGACGSAMAGLASVGLLAVPALVLLTPALVLANNPYCPA